MSIPFDLSFFEKIVAQAHDYLFQHMLSWAMLGQIVGGGGALLLAFRATRAIHAWLARLQAQGSSVPELSGGLPFLTTINRTIRSFLAFIFIWTAFGMAEHFHWARDGLYTAGIILAALTVVRLFTGEMQNRFWASVVAGVSLVYGGSVYLPSQ